MHSLTLVDLAGRDLIIGRPGITAWVVPDQPPSFTLFSSFAIYIPRWMVDQPEAKERRLDCRGSLCAFVTRFVVVSELPSI